MLIAQGTAYFNPDEAAAQIRTAIPGISLAEAQSAAWYQGKRLLERAIAERLDYAFETTLGGNTIPALLEKALTEGIEVRIWYAGLASAELHMARVRSRVAGGGHDIPDEKIRERYARSLLNLIRLFPRLTELRLYDNSHEADPKAGAAPMPRLILHLKRRKVVTVDLAAIPGWAKPVVLSALRNDALKNAAGFIS
jgi:predicted ABC-type ATPase